jgi:hypothetical protein
MIDMLLLTILSAHLQLQAASHQVLPSAASILDRFVQVTYGAGRIRKVGALIVDFSVTDPAGATYFATLYRDHAGHSHIVLDDDNDKREWGVAEDRVWSLSKQGVQFLNGKAANRVLAESHGLSAASLGAFATGWGGSLQFDDWREAFPSVKTVGKAALGNSPCFEVLLTRSDGSTLRRWYEVKSGLLAREVTTEFDKSGVEQPYETDIGDYATTLGFTYPSVFHIKAGSSTFTVKINRVTQGPATRLHGAIEMPREVSKAMTQANTPSGMPNAVDLIERFTQITGGAQTADSIHSEVVKANFVFRDENLQVPMVYYGAGRKNYVSLDVPTMGKFEYGSNGDVSWQRSVVLGPQLLPRSQFGGLLGPGVVEILSWASAGMDLRTVGKETVNGSECYVVEMSGEKRTETAKAYFDVKSGYLLRIEAAAGARSLAEQVTLGDYRNENGFVVAHRVETTLEGKAVVIAMTELQFNGPLPNHVFDLPEDVAALVRHEQEQKSEPADPDSAAKPNLRRRTPN